MLAIRKSFVVSEAWFPLALDLQNKSQPTSNCMHLRFIVAQLKWTCTIDSQLSPPLSASHVNSGTLCLIRGIMGDDVGELDVCGAELPRDDGLGLLAKGNINSRPLLCKAVCVGDRGRGSQISRDRKLRHSAIFIQLACSPLIHHVSIH